MDKMNHCCERQNARLDLILNKDFAEIYFIEVISFTSQKNMISINGWTDEMLQDVTNTGGVCGEMCV